jgi:hypothetical protein
MTLVTLSIVVLYLELLLQRLILAFLLFETGVSNVKSYELAAGADVQDIGAIVRYRASALGLSNLIASRNG